MKPSFGLRTLLAASISAMLAVLIPTRSISAHAHLERSDPAAGARLAAAPSVIRLWFSEAPELALSTVTLVDSLGATVALRAAEQGPDGPRSVQYAIAGTLAPGLYRVRWRVVPADGHPSSGSFVFRVLPSAPAAAVVGESVTPPAAPAAIADTTRMSPEDGALAPLYVVDRFALFLVMIAVLGAVAFRFAVLSRNPAGGISNDELSHATASGGAVLAMLLVVLTAWKLLLQVQLLNGHDVADMEVVAIDTRWGLAWCLQLAGGVLAAVGLLLARRRRMGWQLAAVASVMIAVGTSLGGHAGAAERFRALAVITDSLHVIGAAGWLGSLFWLVWGLRTVVPGGQDRGARAATLVSVFSPAALTFAALVMVTGVVSAWLRLGALPALWTSAYGQMLIRKLVLLAGVAVAGLYNWRRMRPALGISDVSRRFRRSAMIELAFGIGVIVVTAFLVATPPP